MQHTHTSEMGRDGLNQIGILLAVGLAVGLFILVIGRMGLLNRFAPGSAAPAADTGLTSQAMAFSETDLRLKAGERVTIQLDNDDFYDHSFDVDALAVHELMPANDRATATFTPAAPGTYTFYCAIPGHREAGMVGTLVVER